MCIEKSQIAESENHLIHQFSCNKPAMATVFVHAINHYQDFTNHMLVSLLHNQLSIIWKTVSTTSHVILISKGTFVGKKPVCHI